MENILSILQNLELQLQRIRLLYLKWALERFNPPTQDFAELGTDSSFRLIGSNNGHAFDVSPCGHRSCYVGGKKGRLPHPDDKKMWQQDSDLAKHTEETKKELWKRIHELRCALRRLVGEKNYSEAWGALQDYWWIRLGMHELAYDCTLGKPPDREKYPARPLLTESIRCGTNLREKWPHDIEAKDIQHFLSYNLRWDQYALCSYECGPVAVSKRNGFVRFSDIAQDIENLRRRSAPVGDVPEEKKAEAKQSIKKVLRDHYDLLLCYDDMPCYDDKIQGVTHGEFQANKASLLKNVGDVEAGLRKREEALQG